MTASGERENWEFTSWVGRPDEKASGAPTVCNSEIVPEGERNCPICGETMLSTRQHGVLIDVCQAHGLWLDKGELSDVVREIRDVDIRLHVKRMEQEAEKLQRVMRLLSQVLEASHP